jgi:hypothetical protein
MNRWITLAALVAALVLAVGTAWAAEGAAPAAKKINVVLITGGHGFNEPEFKKVFEGYDDITATRSDQKVGGEIFEDISNWSYDVMVLYNFNQKITPKQQENFLKLMDKGVGLLVLHHANGAYNNWPEFWKIAGVTYHFAPYEENGVKMERSGFKGGVKFKIHMADPNHPITKGLTDYDFADETYCRTTIDPANHVLLTTEEPSSDKIIGWTKTYRNSNVCYLQSGHDQVAYQNPIFRTEVSRAIRWVAKRLPETGRAEPAPAARTVYAAPAKKPNVVVVTGGHDFEQKPFLAVFEANSAITFTHVADKDGQLFEDTANFPYDVILLYNYGQKISEKRQKNLLALLDKGVGLVVMHHAVAAYPNWPGWAKLLGARYYLSDVEENGVKHPRSQYKHGVDIKVHVEDASHPITQGVSDFVIHDETYKGYTVDPKVKMLLTTEDPLNNKSIAWVAPHDKTHVCYIQLGHDSKAYATKEFQKLTAQAIAWAAAK